MQSLSCPPQYDILISEPKGMQDLLTIPNSRLMLSLSPFLLLLALLAGSVFFTNPETLPDWAQININVLKYSSNPSVQAMGQNVFGFVLVILWFLVVLRYYITFCLVYFISLSVLNHIPLRERRDGQSPHPSWYANFRS